MKSEEEKEKETSTWIISYNRNSVNSVNFLWILKQKLTFFLYSNIEFLPIFTTTKLSNFFSIKSRRTKDTTSNIVYFLCLKINGELLLLCTNVIHTVVGGADWLAGKTDHFEITTSDLCTYIGPRNYKFTCLGDKTMSYKGKNKRH